jgi:hypothetical protein
MKYLEVSKKITVSGDTSEQDLKQAVLERLRRGFKISHLDESDGSFKFRGTTGGARSVVRHAGVNLDVQIRKKGNVARVFVYGYCSMAKSLLISYSFLFLMVLVAGLLPGSIETGGETSGAIDALVFLIFGIFIFYDINQKLLEPGENIQSALQSLETEFG